MSKVEAAFQTVIGDLGLTGVTVNTGVDDDDLPVPYVVVTAVSMDEEEIKDTAVAPVTVEIMVVSSADDDSLADHRSRCASVFGEVVNTGIEAALSAAVDDFYVYEVDQAGRESDPEDSKLKNTLTLTVVCCPMDIV